MAVKDKRPAAIVLCKATTGIATVRALGQAGIDVHCVILERGDPVRFSRYGRKIHLEGKAADEAGLIEFLIEYAKKLGNRPVVFACSDALALNIARNSAILDPVCRIPANSYPKLISIVSKDGLYRTASAAAVNIIPYIVSEDAGEISQWSLANPEPYLIKPFYEGIPAAALTRKNLQIATRQELLAYAAAQGSRAVIVQRLLQGGDGFIFDCYGLCDRRGAILTMASHRRWRQHPPDFGSTTFGEIPAGLGAAQEDTIFRATERLLERVTYHGIFGIEWLLEKSTGTFYLIDFNARPFTTIGHLQACGVNLPLLSYLELTGEAPSEIERKPRLKQILWWDMLRDMNSFQQKHALGQITFWEWISSIARCRELAYFRLNDPLPGLERNREVARKLLRLAFKYFLRGR